LPSINDTFPGALLQSIPTSKRIKSFNIYYKYSGKIGDSASISLTFYKENVKDSNIIGSSEVFFSNNINWTKLSGNIDWQSTDMPDTVLAFISTSGSNKKDTLFVDDFEMSEFGLSIEDATKNAPILVRNGSTNTLSIINLNSDQPFRLTLRNILGEVVLDKITENGLIPYDNLPVGLYVYELSTATGLSNGKILLLD
jgi:hypothetical protein